ncbi:MAG: nuclear transport factor 2 family protein [Caldilineaceae bacterium]
MTNQHPNITTYIRLMQAFEAGDMQTAGQCASAGIVYHVPGKNPYAGDVVGLNAFKELLDTIRAASAGSGKHTPLHILADDRAVMVYSRVTAERQGKHMDMEVAYLFRFNEEGKVVEGRTIPVDLYAFDEFWT